MVSKSDVIRAAKKELRRTAAERRDGLPVETSRSAAGCLCRHADVLTALAGGNVIVSSYRAMGSEIDPELLEAKLRADTITTALPVITQLGQPLAFHSWQPGDPLVPRKWGILEPEASAPKVEPDILLLPMLAFDRFGWRLGYGGGFYDRTLAQLRARKPIIVIGLAFCEQEVDAVAHDAYDEPLDFVLTPKGLRPFMPSDP